jgi:hypothetical protein
VYFDLLGLILLPPNITNLQYNGRNEFMISRSIVQAIVAKLLGLVIHEGGIGRSRNRVLLKGCLQSGLHGCNI